MTHEELLYLNIARAKLKDSRIIVLDECSDFINPKTELKLSKMVIDKFKSETVIAVPSRVTSLVNYD